MCCRQCAKSTKSLERLDQAHGGGCCRPGANRLLDILAPRHFGTPFLLALFQDHGTDPPFQYSNAVRSECFVFWRGFRGARPRLTNSKLMKRTCPCYHHWLISIAHCAFGTSTLEPGTSVLSTPLLGTSPDTISRHIDSLAVISLQGLLALMSRGRLIKINDRPQWKNWQNADLTAFVIRGWNLQSRYLCQRQHNPNIIS